MERLSIGPYYAQLLPLVAARSTCLRRRVGAIVTDERGVILGTGYNGTPRQLPHCGEAETESNQRWRESRGFARLTEPVCRGAGDTAGNTSRCWAVHAEINALLQCADIERARRIFVSATPCFECAKAIANTGIQSVCALEPYADVLGLDVLKRRGVVVAIWNEAAQDFTYTP